MTRAPRPSLAGLLSNRPGLVSALVVLAGACLVSAPGCNHEPEVPSQPLPCQPGACAPGQWPTMPTPGVDTSPTATPPGIMPAFVGMPCTTTEDLVCGWGKCLAGRCGGCQTNAECKPGGGCGWTPLGMMCMYGGSTAPR